MTKSVIFKALKIKAQKIGEFLQAVKKIIQVRMRWRVLSNCFGMTRTVPSVLTGTAGSQ